MHKGSPHKSRKNKSRRKLYRGGMGATEYVAGMYGDLATQTANLGERMQIMPIQGTAAAQSGGKVSRRKGRMSLRLRIPRQDTSSRLAGGAYYPLQPADYTNSAGIGLSDGQKGGYITQLLERAVVPFGLMALRNYAGKYSRKNRK